MYATLWTDSGIKVWHFAANNVPQNIRDSQPDPSTWGTPLANFEGCDFAGKFRDMSIVSDKTTLVCNGADKSLRSSTSHSVVDGLVVYGDRQRARS